jgi:DNA-binding CsgD family transcriptional regulator
MTDPTWREQEDELAGRLATLHQRVRDEVGVDPGPEAVNRLLSGDLSGSTAALTATCVAQSTSATVRPLLVDLQLLSTAVFTHELGLLSRRLADCEVAVEQLRACSTSQDLLDRVCAELVTRCGFGRAVLSRVDGGMWMPWMAHFTGTTQDDNWFTEWVDRPIPLDGMVVESRILADRRPAAIFDTQAADVYRPIIVDAGHSSSYVVAPVIVADAVIGFLHADYNPTGRRVDVVDRDVLWAFSQGFAQVYERAVLRERLLEQRERVRQVLAASDDLLEAHDLMGPSSFQPVTGSGAVVAQLTERESEVLALVAVGATNAQIAGQLMVAESTVKTHVKHILQKLGVTNRAQAISQYLAV